MKKLLCFIVATVLFASMSTLAFAAGSPSGDVVHKVNVTSTREDKTPGFKSVTDGDTITLTAGKDTERYTFTRWDIDGDYEIVKGTLTSRAIVIRPLTDLDVVSVFEDAEEAEDDDDDDNGKGKTNKDKKSPKTGVAIPLMLGGMVVASATLAGISKKRS